MHHRVIDVAERRFLEDDKLLEFALENHNRFSICGEGRDATVSTWHVDGLVDAYKQAGGRRLTFDEWKARYSHPDYGTPSPGSP